MNTRELSAPRGTLVYLEPVRGLRVLCTVLHAKTSYGHPRIEIAPVAGEGSAWVSAHRVADAAPDAAALPEGR